MTALWLTPDALVADINNPIAWNPYAFNYHDPVNYVVVTASVPLRFASGMLRKPRPEQRAGKRNSQRVAMRGPDNAVTWLHGDHPSG